MVSWVCPCLTHALRYVPLSVMSRFQKSWWFIGDYKWIILLEGKEEGVWGFVAYDRCLVRYLVFKC
jgi:hypothetical protein